MADKKRKGKSIQPETEQGPSKQEKEIASHVYNKCPKKQTLFFSDKVYYFTGTKAVDTLMESKWAKGSKKEDALLRDRDACIEYLSVLMDRGMFVRAQKIVVKKVDTKKDKEKKSDKVKSGKEEKSIKENLSKKDEAEQTRKSGKKKEQGKTASEEKSDDSSEEDRGSSKTDKKDREKKKKKIRLEQHDKQVFLDSNDAYVWTYEPTSIRNIILGLGLVFGSIGICLFPLWPPIVRQGVYYLSLVMVGLIGVLIAVSLLRYVVFAIVWLATGGNLHFWYLPNLTEDCGFFESFVPVYSSTTKKQRDEKTKEKAAKKSKRMKKDDDEEEKDEKKSEKVEEDVKKETIKEPEAVPQDVESEDDFEVIASSQSEGNDSGKGTPKSMKSREKSDQDAPDS